ncbi:MAG TPA: hypothetical protein VL326_37755 [Kofleriaceae bacterium]|nr:hypothetical protein [Kofleriaceae bacterium]
MAHRVSLREMLAVGPRATWRYTGTLLSVFVVQAIITLACIVAITMILTAEFGSLPLWDEAVDGDVVALLWCLKHGEASFVAIGGVVLGALVVWQIATWFLIGGVYGVLVQRPDGRSETARCFGASGAATYLAYARLALCSIPGFMFAMSVMGYCIKQVGGLDQISQALSFSQLAGTLLLMFAPALLVLHIVWTISDYARVEYTLRGESHEPSVVMTYLRSVAYVLKHPLTLAHSGIGWLGFLIVTLIYMFIAQGHPMYGPEGAVALFVIRQGVALARTAIRFGVLAGQIELGKTRPLPPMRVKVVDAKKIA